MPSARSISIAASVLAIVSSAAAQETVQVIGDGSYQIEAGRIVLSHSGPGPVLFKVFGSPTTDIRPLVVTSSIITGSGAMGSGSARVDVLVGSAGSFPAHESDAIGTPLARHWSGLSMDPQLGVPVRVAASISGDLTGDVNVSQVFRLEIGNDVLAHVRASAESGPLGGDAIGSIVVGHSIGASASIEATSEDDAGTVGIVPTIAHIEVGSTIESGGNIAGPIVALHGSILSIRASNSIEIVDGAGDPRAVGIRAGVDLTEVVGGRIVANIVAGDPDDPSTGKIVRVDTTGGELRGSITCNQVAFSGSPLSGFRISGDLNAPLLVNGDMHGDLVIGGAAIGNASLTIRGDLASGKTVEAQGDLPPILVYGNSLAAFVQSVSGRLPLYKVGGAIAYPDATFILARSIDYFSAEQLFSAFVVAPQLGDVRIGELISDGGNTFLFDTFETFDITGAVSNGSLAVSRIPPDRVLRIGGTWGGNSWNTLWIGGCPYAGCSNMENALQGQVVLGARLPEYPLFGTASLYGSGCPSSFCQLVPNGAFPDGYQASVTGNGGAIAAVPFRLSAGECRPVHSDNWSTPAGAHPLLNSQFSHATSPDPNVHIDALGVEMTLFGPVRTNSPLGGDQPVVVWLFLDRTYIGNEQHPIMWADVTEFCDIQVKHESETGFSRKVLVRGLGTLLPPGKYAIVARNDPADPARLFSDQTFVSPPPALMPNMHEVVAGASHDTAQYNFVLYPDSNLDNVLDTGGAACVGNCIADMDDGSGRGFPDGGVGVEDLLFYVALYNAGEARADVDDGNSSGHLDGGVGVEDLIYYLNRYMAGC